MNLLLLLSALLSAFTGIGSGSRAPEAVSAISVGIAVAERAGRATMPVAARPVQPLPRLSFVAAWQAPVAPLIVRAPLYASRRRE